MNPLLSNLSRKYLVVTDLQNKYTVRGPGWLYDERIFYYNGKAQLTLDSLRQQVLVLLEGEDIE